MLIGACNPMVFFGGGVAQFTIVFRLLLVFVLFINLTLTTNYVLSVGISSGLTLLLSS